MWGAVRHGPTRSLLVVAAVRHLSRPVFPPAPSSTATMADFSDVSVDLWKAIKSGAPGSKS